MKSNYTVTLLVAGIFGTGLMLSPVVSAQFSGGFGGFGGFGGAGGAGVGAPRITPAPSSSRAYRHHHKKVEEYEKGVEQAQEPQEMKMHRKEGTAEKEVE